MSTELLTNGDIAAALQEIGDILEIQGENRFRVLGYRRAAENIRGLSRHPRGLAGRRAGSIPGVGEALYEEDRRVAAHGAPGLSRPSARASPTRAWSAWCRSRTSARRRRARCGSVWLSPASRQAEDAARAGQLRELPGSAPGSEAKILAGIESLRPAPEVRTYADRRCAACRARCWHRLQPAVPGIERASRRQPAPLA